MPAGKVVGAALDSPKSTSNRPYGRFGRRAVDAGASPVAHASGELDLANAAEIFGIVAEQVDGTDVLIDLADVTFMDSMSLRELINISRRNPVRVVAPPGSPARRLLDITALVVTIPTYDILAVALTP